MKIVSPLTLRSPGGRTSARPVSAADSGQLGLPPEGARPMLATYRQIYDPLGNSLGISSIVAVLPLAALFVMLGVLRVRAWLASVIGLAVALLIAVTVYSMPVGDALDSGL